MTQQFTDDVEIQGNLQVGDDPGTTNAMIEAQRDATSTTKPKRGLQTTGEIADENAPLDTLTWSNHEVTISGSATDVAQVTALRASAVSSDDGVDSLVGVEANVDPASGTSEAVGVNVQDVTGATENYAIKTGQGIVQLGDLSGQGNQLVQVNNNGDLSTVSPVSVAYPTRAEVFANQFDMITSGKTIVLQNNSARYYGFLGYQSPAANGDEFEFPVLLDQGTYRMCVLGEKDSHLGRIYWYFDGAFEGTQDWYNLSLARNQIVTVSNIVVTAPGNYAVKGKITGRHVSSSGYFFALTKVWFELT